jgi:peptide/nickel transport system substrate-binding protein
VNHRPEQDATTSRRKVRLVIVGRASRRAFLLGSAAFAACSRVDVATRSGSLGDRNRFTIPGTLRYADGEGVSGLNLYLIPQLSVATLANLAMGYLMRYDAQNRPYAELAEEIPSLANGGISRDGRTITFRLRGGVRWHDGAPVTADDVVFSTHAALNPANIVPLASELSAVADVGARGDRTVVFRLKRAYAPFTDGFFSSDSLPILPKHVLGTLPNIDHAPYNDLPIGFGPFKFVRWKRDESVELVASTNYFRGRPLLDRIVYRIVPDWNTILTQFETGALDFACFMPASVYERGRTLQGFRGISAPGSVYSQISFNLQRPPLDDITVRRALRLATDRRTVVAKVLHGLADLQESPVGGQSPHDDSQIPLVPFDIGKANALLDADGWTRGVDGIRTKGARRLAFEVVVSSGQPQRDLEIEIVRNDWGKIGASLTVKHYLPSLLYGAAADGGILVNGRFDAEVSNEGYGAFGDLSPSYSCAAMRPRGNNVDAYCSARFDADENAFDSTYDPAQSQRLADRAQEQLVEDVPTMVVDIPRDLFVLNRDFRGFAPRVTFDGSERWSIG